MTIRSCVARTDLIAVSLASALVLMVGWSAEAASITFETQALVSGAGVGDGTRSFGDFAATVGIAGVDTESGPLFNIDETNPQPTVVLAALQPRAFGPDGGLLFPAPYSCVACGYDLRIMLAESAPGRDGSELVLRAALTPIERMQLLGGAGNLGMTATIRDTGLETFDVGDVPPAPAASEQRGLQFWLVSLVLIVAGLVGTWTWWRSGRPVRPRRDPFGVLLAELSGGAGDEPTCPACDSTRLRRSHVRRWERPLVRLTDYRPYRCESCLWRGWHMCNVPGHGSLDRQHDRTRYRTRQG